MSSRLRSSKLSESTPLSSQLSRDSIGRNVLVPDSDNEAGNCFENQKLSSKLHLAKSHRVRKVLNNGRRNATKPASLNLQRHSVPSQIHGSDRCTPNKRLQLGDDLRLFIRQLMETTKCREEESIILKFKLNKARLMSAQFKEERDTFMEERDTLMEERDTLMEENHRLKHREKWVKEEKKKFRQNARQNWKIYLKSEEKNIRLEKLYLEANWKLQEGDLSNLLHL